MLEEDYFVQTSEAILFRSKAQCPFIKLPGGLKLSLCRFPLFSFEIPLIFSGYGLLCRYMIVLCIIQNNLFSIKSKRWWKISARTFQQDPTGRLCDKIFNPEKNSFFWRVIKKKKSIYSVIFPLKIINFSNIWFYSLNIEKNVKSNSENFKVNLKRLSSNVF